MIDLVAQISAFVQVVLVDIVLAGDNAIVIARVVCGFPLQERVRLLMLGIAAATVVRIIFAVLATQLMQIVGLMFAGGLLLLWVCFKLWRELAAQRVTQMQVAGGSGGGQGFAGASPCAPKSVRAAVAQIVIADVSMSVDNVLAVAGIARDHVGVLVFGLVLSIAFMGLAATFIARALQKHAGIAYIGLFVIVYVACVMIWDGAMSLIDHPAVAVTFR